LRNVLDGQIGDGYVYTSLNQALFNDNTIIHLKGNGCGTAHEGEDPNQNVVISNNIIADWNSCFFNPPDPPSGVSYIDNITSNNPADFPDITRDLPTYNTIVLGRPHVPDESWDTPGGADVREFADQAREQRKGYWRPEYMAQEVNAWIREGFTIP